jgi:hypothetical protein
MCCRPTPQAVCASTPGPYSRCALDGLRSRSLVGGRHANLLRLQANCPCPALVADSGHQCLPTCPPPYPFVASGKAAKTKRGCLPSRMRRVCPSMLPSPNPHRAPNPQPLAPGPGRAATSCGDNPHHQSHTRMPHSRRRRTGRLTRSAQLHRQPPRQQQGQSRVRRASVTHRRPSIRSAPQCALAPPRAASRSNRGAFTTPSGSQPACR